MSLIANSVYPDERPHFMAFHQFSLFLGVISIQQVKIALKTSYIVLTLKGIEYTANQATFYFCIPHIL